MSEEVQTPDVNQPVSFINEDGTWNRAAFEEGLGEHSIFDKYKTVPDMVKGTINAQDLIGKKAEEFWTSEEPEHIQKRKDLMGIPNEADAYEFEYPEQFAGLPEERRKAISEYLEDSKTFALENWISKSAYKAMVERDLERAAQVYNENVRAMEEAAEKAHSELKKEWGNKYDYRMSKAEDALEAADMGLLAEYVKQDPKLAKEVFEKLVPLYSDDQLVNARQNQSIASMSDHLEKIQNELFKMDRYDPDYNYKLKEYEDALKKLS